MNYDKILWFIAFVTFVFGDLLTTFYGFQHSGIYEQAPTGQIGLAVLGFVGLIAVKISFTAIMAAVYHVVQSQNEEAASGIPFGLVLVGATATVWNIHIIVLAGGI